MACGARLPDTHAWLRGPIAQYIAEESGHEEWILNDIAAAGGDVDAVRASSPGRAAELLVAYVYDTIARGNPVGFFGMVHVLEGTSQALATRAAQVMRESLGLPPEAFTYLTSHGTLDQEHVRFFAGLMNRLDAPADREAVTRGAHRIPAMRRHLPDLPHHSAASGTVHERCAYRAVLTGATGGIGRAMALRLGPLCESLILVARDAAALAALARDVEAAGGRARAVPADLTTPAGRDAVLRAAAETRGGIDLLVNNAGAGGFAWLADQDDAALERIVHVNVLVPMQLTRRLLPLMLAQPAARIVNVGSIFGYLGYPGHAAYSASKFALRGFSGRCAASWPMGRCR
jgi:hypothetical protein